DGRQRLLREHEAADVNRTVTWQLVQSFDEVGEHAHTFVLGIQAGLTNDAGCRLRLTKCRRGIAAFVAGLLRAWIFPPIGLGFLCSLTSGRFVSRRGHRKIGRASCRERGEMS